MCDEILVGCERKGEKSKEVKITELNYPGNFKIMTVTWQSALFKSISIGMTNNIMHHVTCLLDTGADPKIINQDFLPAH